MTRPAIYLPALTDEELVRFVSQYGGTELEQDLVRRLSRVLDAYDDIQEDLDAELNTNAGLYERVDDLEHELKECR